MRQCLMSSGLGESSTSSSSSLKMGSETTYFSDAQLPKSCSLQRSLQKGNSVLTSEFVGFLQIGQRCCMALCLDFAPSAFDDDSPHRDADFAPMLCSTADSIA